MNGARNYCSIFKKAEQIGRLYILPHYHARGKTFRIYVLPDGESVIKNGGITPPLNKDAVQVYGAISGQLGWTESYGWRTHGKWVQDFEAIVDERAKEILKKDSEEYNNREKKIEADKRREFDLLATY
jgi:hypothetical protein